MICRFFLNCLIEKMIEQRLSYPFVRIMKYIRGKENVTDFIVIHFIFL